jgi:hypothetical protein
VHFVVAVIVPKHLLDALAWVLTAIGFTAAATVLAPIASASGERGRAT